MWERSAEYEIGLGELDNRSELTLGGIAFSAEGKCTELSENLDQGRGEKRANTLFFGFSTSN